MALQIADRGYAMEAGEIVLECTGRELLDNDEVLRAYLGWLGTRTSCRGTHRTFGGPRDGICQCATSARRCRNVAS